MPYMHYSFTALDLLRTGSFLVSNTRLHASYILRKGSRKPITSSGATITQLSSSHDSVYSASLTIYRYNQLSAPGTPRISPSRPVGDTPSGSGSSIKSLRVAVYCRPLTRTDTGFFGGRPRLAGSP